MIEHKFKAGDRVRAIEDSPRNGLTRGEVFTVRAAEPSSAPDAQMLTLAERFGDVYSFRFELVESPIQKGDHVRVTIEGVYYGGHGITEGTFTGDQRDWDYWSEETDTVTVEKIEPPVEQFGPGDVVRCKREGSLWQLLGTSDEPKGFVRLGRSRLGAYYVMEGGSQGQFTSENYERVELNEVGA